MNKRVPLLLILGTLAAAVAYTAVTTDKPKEFWAGLFLDGVTSGSLFALIALGYLSPLVALGLLGWLAYGAFSAAARRRTRGSESS